MAGAWASPSPTYDNDGKLDLFVTGYGGNVLYRNLGNCKFEDVTEKAGVRGGGFSTGAAWGDYDRDGNVDLFVSRYVHVDIAHMPAPGSNKFCLYKGLQVQCGPWGLEGESDLLYHNRGDGTFEEVSVKAGVHNQIGYYGLGAMWSDYDNDGWPDLVVANDSVPNYLYHNNRNGTFSEVGMLSGISLSGDGTQLGNMGVDFADYDHSGRFSLFITTFQEQPKALWRNTGANGFEDVSWPSGVGRPSYQDVCWGTSFFDMANTGWLDLLIACGHVYPQIDSLDNSPHYRQPIFLERNNRDGTFDEVGERSRSRRSPAKITPRRGLRRHLQHRQHRRRPVERRRTSHSPPQSKRRSQSPRALQTNRHKEQSRRHRRPRHHPRRRRPPNRRSPRRRTATSPKTISASISASANPQKSTR